MTIPRGLVLKSLSLLLITMNQEMSHEERIIDVRERLNRAIYKCENRIYEKSSRDLLVGHSALRVMREAIDAAKGLNDILPEDNKMDMDGYESLFSECKSYLNEKAVEASMRSFRPI